MGLATWSFMPAAKQRCQSASMALAVMAITGRSCRRGSCRSCRVAVSPSITGICMSISTTSYEVWRNWSKAIWPLSATSTTNPASRNSSTATIWLSSLSSTSSTRAPRMATGNTSGAGAAAGVREVLPPAPSRGCIRVSSNTDAFTGLMSTVSMPSERAARMTSSRP